jgi:gliding motility-associated-like protein
LAISGTKAYADTAIVIISIVPINHPIVAINDSVFGTYGVSLTTPAVTLNDYDYDDNIADKGNMSTATVFIDNSRNSTLAKPKHGSYVLNPNNTFTWTPFANTRLRGYHIDSFQYVISDNYDPIESNSNHAEQGLSYRDTAWVFISVGKCDLKIDAGQYQVICPGNSIKIGGSNTASGGFGNYTYYWSDTSNTFNANIANPTFLPNKSTLFVLQVVDESACHLTDTVSILVKQTVPANFVLDSIFCKGATPVQLTGYPLGGTFYGDGVTSIGGTTYFTPSSATEDTPLTITYSTIQNGCYVNASRALVVHQTPNLSIGANQVICPQLQVYSAQLYVSGADSFVWTPANTLNDPHVFNPIATPNGPTVYTVIGYSNGCTAQATVRIDTCKLPSSITVDAMNDSAKVRMNQSAIVFVTSNDTASVMPLINYQLAPVSMPVHGDIQIQGATIKYTPNKNFVGRDTFQYQICIHNAVKDTCDIASVFITVLPYAPDYWLGTQETPLPCIDTLLHPASTISNGLIQLITMPIFGTAWVDSSGYVYYQGGNPDATLDSFVYQVSVNGLSDTGIIYIYSSCTPPILPCMIPEGLSPNNDNVNDYFYIDCIPQYPHSRLTVYNRWGNSVHNTSPYQNNWDGKYNGQDLPDGTYFYILQFNDGVTPNKLGYLVLHR